MFWITPRRNWTQGDPPASPCPFPGLHQARREPLGGVRQTFCPCSALGRRGSACYRRSRPDHQHEEADASEANNASRVGLFVEMGGQIVGANSLRCLLTAFHANDRQRDFPDQDLAQKFLDGEVTEIIAAHPPRPGSQRACSTSYLRSGAAVPGSIAKFTGMRRAASLLSAVLFYSSTRSIPRGREQPPLSDVAAPNNYRRVRPASRPIQPSVTCALQPCRQLLAMVRDPSQLGSRCAES